MNKIDKQCVWFCALFIMAFCLWGMVSVQAAAGLNQTEATICVQQQTKLKLQGTQKKVKWASADKSIAKVSSKGVVTGLQPGTARITAKAGKNSYTCQVTVNATYGANVSAVKIRKQKAVTVYFTQDAAVTFHIQDPAICSAAWGTWSGNEVPLLITPKKKGTTYITCSNNANEETIKIAVTVTSVPVAITDLAVDTSDKGELVCGLNKAKITFQQDRKSAQTILMIVNQDGDVIKSMDLGPVTKKRYTATWDGKTDKGMKYEGSYSVKISADKYVAESKESHICFAKSPFAGGTGSKKQPFLVSTAEQLQDVPAYNGRYFQQSADIDLQSSRISGLFTEKDPFRGSYDGAGYQLSNCYEDTSLFGVIAAEGVLQDIDLQSFRMQLNKEHSAAFLAEKNLGTMKDCHVQDGLLNANVLADVAMLVVENDGIMQDCSVGGYLYGCGNMGGCAVRNKGRMLSCKAAVELHFRAEEGVTTGSALLVGGVVAENTVTAFLTGCKGDQSSLYAEGQIPEPLALYMGGIAGTNSGQIQSCSFLGKFAKNQTENLTGKSYLGMAVGENKGMVLEVSYYATTGRNGIGTGSGRVSDLVEVQNPYEEASSQGNSE